MKSRIYAFWGVKIPQKLDFSVFRESNFTEN
ncbi:MAG: hypothetical protein JWM68_5514 [Verrucomicrobiales bacterium]|nr:hypothetical protein [Verrucomicrobiales bacterium]